MMEPVYPAALRMMIGPHLCTLYQFDGGVPPLPHREQSRGAAARDRCRPETDVFGLLV
jgi:hypothetical protein